jgi:L-2-hydroxyglutarate oxidase
MIDGSVTVGPNAVLGLSREGYPRLSFSAADTLDFLAFPGFWKLIMNYPKQSINELKNSYSKSSYLRECQKYCPSLDIDDLLPFRAGIRAQLVTSRGELVHDFIFKKTQRMLHVLNAPSPAATSALPIGSMIAKMSCEV